MAFKIFVGNDNLVWLTGLQDDVTEVFEVAGAKLSLEIFTSDVGSTMVGSAAMTFLPGSTTGEYYGGIDDAINLEAGVEYQAKVIAVSSSGITGTWAHNFTARVRT